MGSPSRSPRRNSGALVAACVLGVISLTAWSIRANSNDPYTTNVRVASAEDGAAESYAAWSKARGFAGAESCQRCHQKEYDLWLTSSHYHTVEAANEDNMPGAVLAEEAVSHAPGTSTFRKKDGGFVVDTMGPDGKVHEYPLTHVVGRMRVRMYLTTLPDGRMQVLPGMMEAQSEKWFDYTRLIFGAGGTDWDKTPVVKPGDLSFWTGAVRSWDNRCVRCHSGGYRAEDPAIPGERKSHHSFRQIGVDCEMCHGPAQSHVDFQNRKEAGRPIDGPDPIIALKKLDPLREVSVCMQCHMEGDLVDNAFKVGDDIFEHLDPTLLIDPERLDVTGRPLELVYDGVPFHTSRCVLEGNLTCATCHNPHGSSARSQLRESATNEALCASCHEEIASNLSAHTHHQVDSSGSQCISCHMHFMKVERGHGVIADHSIGIPRLEMESDRLAQDACTWCHTQGLYAPTDAPKQSNIELRTAYAKWWPGGGKPKPWMEALSEARMGDDGAHRSLMETIDNKALPRVVRASAMELLGMYAKEVPLAIMSRTKDPDSLVRRRAIGALAELKGESIDTLLKNALSDESAAVRIAAARTATKGWSRIRANKELRNAVIPVLDHDARDLKEDWFRWWLLAGVQDLSGNAEDALAAYERVAALDPFNKGVRKRIEQLRDKLQIKSK